MKKIISHIIPAIALLTAPMLTIAEDLENWIYQPVYENGLAAVGCASSSGNFNIDKKRAESAARTSLIQSINLKASNMDKHASALISNAQGTEVTETFSSISKQISHARLNRSKIVKLDVGAVYGEKQVCAMAAIANDTLEAYFDDMLKMSGAQINPEDKTAMYQEFKTQKAVSDLEGELTKLTQ